MASIGAAVAILIVALVLVARPWSHPNQAAQPAPPASRSGSAQGTRSPEPAGPAERAAEIAFASKAGGGVFHIHVINADGTGDTTLTSGPGEERTPAWSPDRTRIAFVRRANPADPSEGKTDIYIMRADGTATFQFTDGPGMKGDPAWSPDGRRIAFFGTDPRTGRRRIVVEGVDTKERLDLSDPPESCNDREPSWSPDARRIVFVRKCGDAASALYFTDVDGKGVLLLTEFGRTPDWSPDGAKIVYTGLGTVGPSIYVIDVDGREKTELTDGRISGDPEWSPSGAEIVFVGSDLAAVDLFIMKADGSQVHRLTSNPSDDVTASW